MTPPSTPDVFLTSPLPAGRGEESLLPVTSTGQGVVEGTAGIIAAGRPARSADLGLLLVAMTWGGSYLAAKILTRQMSPETLLALRFVPSLLVLCLVAGLRRSRFTRRGAMVGIVLGAFQAVTLLLETTAVTRTSATNAGVLICLAVIIAPALESLMARNRLPGKYYLVAAVSIGGVVLLLGPAAVARPNTGDLLVLMAACTRACLMVSSGRLTSGHHFDAVAINTTQTAFNAVLFTLLAGRSLPPTVSRLTAQGWLVLAFLALGCTCAAFLVQLWAIHHTSATRASLLMGTEPVWALFAGILLAGDHLGILGALGAIIVIGSTAWGQRIETRWRRPVAQSDAV